MGGGLTHTESKSLSAYLTAAAFIEKGLQKGNPAFLPFSGPRDGLLQDTHVVLQADDGHLPPLYTVVNDIPGLQIMFALDTARRLIATLGHWGTSPDHTQIYSKQGTCPTQSVSHVRSSMDPTLRTQPTTTFQNVSFLPGISLPDSLVN